MKLARLRGAQGTGDFTVNFLGMNVTDTIGKGEFSFMENMTGDRFPHLAPRKARGTIGTLTKANGLYAREALFWVDGGAAYYDGKKVFDVGDSKKQFISMGARILIFPDKVFYNIADGTYGGLENKVVTTGTVTYKASFLTETGLDPTGQVYVRIEGVGIEKGFEKGDGIHISDCVIPELNKTAVIQEIGTGFILIIGAMKETTTQTTALTLWRKLPDMDFMAVSENRLWGCSSKNHEVYGSKLGSPFNFYCFEGLASDSYAATVAGDGSFTGAITYLGYVLFFKENGVHKVYGNKPANFQIIEGQLRGVEAGSSQSLVIVNEVLYYKSVGGVMSFQGSLPYEVGNPLGNGYHFGAAGATGSKYYISMKDGGGKHHLFVYDTGRSLWHREDNTQGDYFTRLGDKLYYLSGNEIKTTAGEDQEIIEWMVETGDFTYQTADSKYITRISLRLSTEGGSGFEAWIDYDSRGAWERMGSCGDRGKGVTNFPLIPKRCDHFKLKFKGFGMSTIYDMTIYLTGGSNERRR